MVEAENRIINLTNGEFIEVGKRISACRKSSGMTLDEVGQLLGLHRSSILRYESGHTKQIKLVILERLAQIFNTTPEYLMTGCEKKEDDAKDASVSEEVSESKTQPPLIDPPAPLTFAGEDELPKVQLNVRSPLKYEAHIPPPLLYTDEEIVSAMIENTLPHVFAYMNYCRDFSPRISPGDILTVRATDQFDSGDLCLLMTRERAVVLRRIFHTRLGVTLVSENPDIPPDSLSYIGRNSGFTMIGRITHLSASL